MSLFEDLELNQALKDHFSCRFIEPFETIFDSEHYAVVDVFEKVVMIQRAKSIDPQTPWLLIVTYKLFIFMNNHKKY